MLNNLRNISDIYISETKRMFKYRGVSTRKEYWYFNLVFLIVSILIRITQGILGNSAALLTGGFPAYSSVAYVEVGIFEAYDVIPTIFLVLLKIVGIVSTFHILSGFLASCSLTVRRLRDIGRSWKWVFIFYVPFISIIFQLLWFTKPSIKKQRRGKQKSIEVENIKSTQIPVKKEKLIATNQSSSSISVQERLKELKDMFDQQLISEEEYDLLRKKVLGL